MGDEIHKLYTLLALVFVIRYSIPYLKFAKLIIFDEKISLTTITLKRNGYKPDMGGYRDG